VSEWRGQAGGGLSRTKLRTMRSRSRVLPCARHFSITLDANLCIDIDTTCGARDDTICGTATGEEGVRGAGGHHSSICEAQCVASAGGEAMQLLMRALHPPDIPDSPKEAFERLLQKAHRHAANKGQVVQTTKDRWCKQRTGGAPLAGRLGSLLAAWGQKPSDQLALLAAWGQAIRPAGPSCCMGASHQTS